MIWIIILSFSTVFCAFKWFHNYIISAVLMSHMVRHGYPVPTDEETKEGTRWVLRHIIRDLMMT